MREAIEAAKKLRTISKGQITNTVNRLKAILSEATNKTVRPLVNDLETQNLFAKLQRLASTSRLPMRDMCH